MDPHTLGPLIPIVAILAFAGIKEAFREVEIGRAHV